MKFEISKSEIISEICEIFEISHISVMSEIISISKLKTLLVGADAHRRVSGSVAEKLIAAFPGPVFVVGALGPGVVADVDVVADLARRVPFGPHAGVALRAALVDLVGTVADQLVGRAAPAPVTARPRPPPRHSPWLLQHLKEAICTWLACHQFLHAVAASNCCGGRS
jgi:hypothetical protein